MDVRELSHGGFSVVTTAHLVPGDELSVRLVGGAASWPIRTQVVVESRLEASAHEVESQPCVRFRLLRFSQDYSLLISGGSSSEIASNPTQQSVQSKRRSAEKEWIVSVLEPEDETPQTERPQDQEWPEWEEYEPLSERAGEPLWSEDALAPVATVIDDGELDDVVRVLAEFGVKVDRLSPDEDSFVTSWVRPQHLLVVTAKRALMHRLPLRSQRQNFVSIAVADSDFRLLRSSLRTLGYQYVISRPIHPLAMSMLFSQAIFPGHDQRVVPREILGCPVHWWCGWARKQPGVMLDASLVGCQLLVRDSVAQGSRIKIRVPGGVANGRAFTLVGQVERLGTGHRGTTLGIRFDELSAKVQQRLQLILALPGPFRLTGGSSLLEDAEAASRRVKRAHDVPQTDRRRKYRAAICQEIVALEHGSNQMKHVLVGSDLTADGMRVEAHPSLVMGEQMDLALYEESERSPLILSAVIARDDERSGWWLRFVGVTSEAHERLTQILDRLPPVTRLDRPDSEVGRVALSQRLVRRKPLGEDELA